MPCCKLADVDVVQLHSDNDVEAILANNLPIVFRGAALHWPAAQWTPAFLRKEFGTCKATMRFIPTSKLGEVVWEADCERHLGIISEFVDWLSGEPEKADGENSPPTTGGHCQLGRKRKRDSSLLDGTAAEAAPRLEELFPRHQWCGYMDYMHFEMVFGGRLDAVEGAVDLSQFKVDATKLRSNANTQCHYDTYGFNLVGQVHGSKRWWLYPPSSTRCLYPTRVPYEESSVYSQVFVPAPDLTQFPLFPAAEGRFVELQPGDVLYVPKHWWHFASSVDVTVSVNQWVDVPSDSQDRLQESIVRFLVSSLLGSAGQSLPLNRFVNPNEELWDHDQCLEAFQTALAECCDAAPEGDSALMTLLLRCVTSQQVLQVCTEQLLATVPPPATPPGPDAARVSAASHEGPDPATAANAD